MQQVFSSQMAILCFLDAVWLSKSSLQHEQTFLLCDFSPQVRSVDNFLCWILVMSMQGARLAGHPSWCKPYGIEVYMWLHKKHITEINWILGWNDGCSIVLSQVTHSGKAMHFFSSN
jgi:hypothetical protein